MRVLLITATLLLSSTSFANFTGIWQGDATVTKMDGTQFYCDEIIIQVKNHGTDKIEFGKFRYACDEFAINFTPPVLTLAEKKFLSQEVFWKEQSVGKISSKKANLLFPLANNGKARYTVKKISETEMNYLDEQIGFDAQGKEVITAIKANLKKVN